MIGELYRSCPACSSKNLLNKGKPLDSSAGSPYSVIECLDCKLNWCSPMPTVKELNEYYNRYYEIRYSTVDKNPKIAKIRSILTFRKNRLRMFFNLIEKYSPGKSIIDFGCGEADVLYEAKSRGWKVLGIDYSNELSERFKRDNVEFVCANSLDAARIDEHSFHCISAKHVIEHIPEIENFLFSVRKYLKPNGIFAVKTPSASSLRARTGLANWHLVRPMEHFWGFDKHNFRKLLEKNGFELLFIRDSMLVDELVCISRSIQ